MEKINYTTAEINEKLSSIGSPSSSLYFTPMNIFDKTATTIVIGQSSIISFGITKLYLENISLVRTIIVGLGASNSVAESACTSGVEGSTKFTLTPGSVATINVTSGNSYAWKSTIGIASLKVIEGK